MTEHQECLGDTNLQPLEEVWGKRNSHLSWLKRQWCNRNARRPWKMTLVVRGIWEHHESSKGMLGWRVIWWGHRESIWNKCRWTVGVSAGETQSSRCCVSLIPPWFLWPRTMTLVGPWWPVLILVTRCCFWPADKWGLKGNPYAGNGGRLVKEPAVSVTAIPLYFGLNETLYIGYWTPLSPLSYKFHLLIWCISGEAGCRKWPFSYW